MRAHVLLPAVRRAKIEVSADATAPHAAMGETQQRAEGHGAIGSDAHDVLVSLGASLDRDEAARQLRRERARVKHQWCAPE